jgi:dihydroceramidase
MDVQMRHWQVGHWGPVTATLDWCEVRHYSSTHLTSPFHYYHHVRFQANYQFSHYVAEMSNTFSNLFFVCISLYGARLSSRESLPARYLVGFAVRLFARFFKLPQPLT